MVTRRFKKGSVYDALASTSGLDFSPVVQLKTYHPRRDDGTSNSGVKMPSRIWEESTSKRAVTESPKEPEKNASTVIKEVPSSNSSSENECKKNSPRESKRFQQPLPQVPSNHSSCPYTSHEKYPSWPVTNVSNPNASFRSHSWIPETDYPKEKVGYLRPKKSFKISTNQLQPVLEKSPDSGSSKKSPEILPSPPKEIRPPSVEDNNSLDVSYNSPSGNCSNKTFDFEAFHTPCIPQCYGEKDYSIHSPPERDISACSVVGNDTISSESNSFLSKYEDVLRHQAQYSSPLLFWNKQSGNEEKENSSIDTPFLDRLRLDSARAWPQAPPPPPPPPAPALLVAPPQNDIELSSENGTWMGSMESSSHGRGLPKWQGSYSDLSTLSTQLSNRSSLFDSGHSTMPESGRLSPQSSCGSTAPSLLLEGPTRAQVVARHGCHREIVAHSAKVQQPERHGSESVLYYASGAPSRPKTAMAFNGDDHDRMKSPEPIPGPSGIQFNLPLDESLCSHRNRGSSHSGSLQQNSFKMIKPASSTDVHLTKRDSRNSNSFSSEDSSFRTKDVSDDTSGSSSDVSNITCISNYRESSQSWDAGSSIQNCSPPALCASNKSPSKPSSSSDAQKFQSTCSLSIKQPNSADSSEKYRKSNSSSNYGIVQKCSQRQNVDPLSKDRYSDQHIRQRSAESSLKSRSMDEASRRLLYNDIEKRQRVSEPDLKTIQKQAVFSFYQRMSLAESVRGSSSSDSTKSPTDHDPPPAYELPSPTRLKMSVPKLSILPNKYTPQGFDDKRSNNFSDTSCQQSSNINPESPSRTDPQTGLLNSHSKSVPNLLTLRSQSLDLSHSNRHSELQQAAWNNGGQVSAKRGSPLAKEEIIPWDQLPNVLERRREAVGRASLTSESKEPPEDGSSNSRSSSATNYFKGHKSPRKVQLKEVHHANETASVKVITHDGVTLVQTTSDKSNNLIYSKDNGKKAKEEKTKAHFKRRPAPPPPPKQPPKRPPPPPPPESPSPTPPTVVIMEDNSAEATSDVEKELQELRIDERRLDVSGGRRLDAMPSSSSSPQLLGSYGGEGECCSSPDLPLPPPPSSDNHGEVVVHDPLPPPPEVIDVELPSRTLDSSLVYPKNSYMSYRSEKKLGRQGFEGNYRRSFHSSASSMDLSTLGNGFQDGVKDALSPSTWEFVHNIRQHGTTVIFHSDALHSSSSQPQRSPSQELQSEDHRVNGNQVEGAKLATNQDTPNTVPCPPTSQDTACESPSGEVTSLSTDSPMSPSLESKTNDSIVIQCDLSSEDVSSLENCLLTDDSFVDSMESDTSSLISVDQNQNSVDIKCDRTIPAIVSNNNNINNNNNNNNNDLVIRTNSSTQTTDTPRLRRKCSKTKEELECERLSVTFLHHFGDYRLKNLLVPAANHKTMSDYMDGLLNFELEKGDVSLQRSPIGEESERKQNGHWEDNTKASEKANDSLDFKVKQLNHYMDIIENQNVGGELELKKLRDELMTSIKKKVEVMRAEQVVIREEIQRNEKLGKDLANRVQKVAKPNEVEKYILHVEETEKIVNLLLSLSGRLAKAENMLGSIPKDASPEEKRIVQAKRDKLLEQHEDARRLKESIDRRSNHISAFLQKYLSEEEYADYDYFIKMKTKLIADTREMDEKINLGEEQLVALRNSIDAHLWKSANS